MIYAEDVKPDKGGPALLYALRAFELLELCHQPVSSRELSILAS
eukprot:COSAG01_NODE_66659_length_269_cov_0.905882_1_plen_43_part_10